ncbi:MAG TPA: hypothetical protein VEC12_11985 [Bacteroidia bacterium]|nr:hypothetical protein [Bacteroidia bacterium]
MNIVITIVVLLLIPLTVMMCRQESRRRKIGFVPALLVCVIASPLFGYFIISSIALRTPAGCQWCGNSENEAVYCGTCGKNQDGLLKSR